MNRILLFFVLIIHPTIHLLAQQAEENSIAGLRALSAELNLPNANNVTMLCSWNDSLANRNMQWKVPYDNLMRDSISLVQMERELVGIDALLVQYYLKPSSQNFAKVKILFSASKELLDSVSAYTKELHAIMRELAVENADYPLAYSLQNKLHAFQYADWLEADKLQDTKFDSLQQRVEQVEKSSNQELTYSRSQTMQWHIIAVIAIGVAIVLLILVLFFRWRWKKRMLQLMNKANDKSEEEVLVQKLELARREITELRVVAKKKVETIAPDVISPVPSGVSISTMEIAQWNDQIQQALAKIKSHCEAGKSSMGVPTYMSIINDTGRLSSLVQQKSEEWVALLSAEKDMK